VELTVREEGARSGPELLGDGRAGAEDAAEGREGEVLGDAVVADFAPERGGAERVGDVFLANGLDDFRGIDGGGAAGVDFRHDGGHAERGVEEREDREERKIDFAGLDVVGVADQADLGVEHAVFVADAFGGAGGAGGEQHRRQFGGGAVHRLRVES